MFVCTCTCASMQALAILWIQCFTWVLGIEFRPLGLHDKCLYPLSHPAILRFIGFLPLFLQLGSLSYLQLTIFSILEFQDSGLW